MGLVHEHAPRGRAAQARLNYRQMAALAAGVLCEVDADRPDKPFWEQTIRATVVEWRRGLSDNGTLLHPLGRLRTAPVAAYQLVRLLEETTAFQSDDLLTDLHRHLNWLLKHRFGSTWVKACLIGSAIGGALILRDSAMLQVGRRRLERLLRQQDEEGWFRERGGVDIGRLSLTVDILARLLVRHGWTALLGPLEAAIGFLQRFVRRDGTAGGCYCTHGTGFVSPYGIELMSNYSSAAARLGQILRNVYETIDGQRILAWSEELCAVMGPGLSLATTIETGSREVRVSPAEFVRSASDAPTVQPALVPATKVDGNLRSTNWSHAGLVRVETPTYEAVASLAQGGAVQVHWREGAPPLSDRGVIVLFPQHASEPGGHLEVSFEGDPPVLSCQGRLRHTRRIRVRWFVALWRQMMHALRRSPKKHAGTSVRTQAHRHGVPMLPHDHFRREITFRPEGIGIRDHIQCHRDCDAVVLLSPRNNNRADLTDRAAAPMTAPLYLEGGKTVTITREYRAGAIVQFDVETE